MSKNWVRSAESPLGVIATHLRAQTGLWLTIGFVQPNRDVTGIGEVPGRRDVGFVLPKRRLGPLGALDSQTGHPFVIADPWTGLR